MANPEAVARTMRESCVARCPTSRCSGRGQRVVARYTDVSWGSERAMVSFPVDGPAAERQDVRPIRMEVVAPLVPTGTERDVGDSGSWRTDRADPPRIC